MIYSHHEKIRLNVQYKQEMISFLIMEWVEVGSSGSDSFQDVEWRGKEERKE